MNKKPQPAKEETPKKPPLPRYEWSRNPIEKPHSTKKGKKGYSRDQIKKDTQDEMEDG